MPKTTALIHVAPMTSHGATAARAIIAGNGETCIDCSARRTGVAVETLVAGLLRMQQVVRVKSTVGRCPTCAQLALRLRI